MLEVTWHKMQHWKTRSPLSVLSITCLQPFLVKLWPHGIAIKSLLKTVFQFNTDLASISLRPLPRYQLHAFSTKLKHPIRCRRTPITAPIGCLSHMLLSRGNNSLTVSHCSTASSVLSYRFQTHLKQRATRLLVLLTSHHNKFHPSLIKILSRFWQPS